MNEFFLYMAHRVVAEITGQTAAKTRHARSQSHFETLLIGLNEIQWIASGGFNHLAIGDDFGDGVLTKALGT